MSFIDVFKHWNSLCKEFEEMQPATDQIYYFTLNCKAQPKIETIKHKKTLENE